MKSLSDSTDTAIQLTPEQIEAIRRDIEAIDRGEKPRFVGPLPEIVFLPTTYLDAVENALSLGQLCRGYLDESIPSTPRERRVAIAAFDAAIQDLRRVTHVRSSA